MTIIAVLGAGKIGEALLSGLINAGRSPDDLMLTERYPDRAAELMAHLERWLSQPSLRESLADNHRRLLADKLDMAEWFVDFLEGGATLPKRGGR